MVCTKQQSNKLHRCTFCGQLGKLILVLPRHREINAAVESSFDQRRSFFSTIVRNACCDCEQPPGLGEMASRTWTAERSIGPSIKQVTFPNVLGPYRHKPNEQKVALSFGLSRSPCAAALRSRPPLVELLDREILMRKPAIGLLIGQWAWQSPISGSSSLAPPCYPWRSTQSLWASSQGKSRPICSGLKPVFERNLAFAFPLRPRLVRGFRVVDINGYRLHTIAAPYGLISRLHSVALHRQHRTNAAQARRCCSVTVARNLWTGAEKERHPLECTASPCPT